MLPGSPKLKVRGSAQPRCLVLRPTSTRELPREIGRRPDSSHLVGFGGEYGQLVVRPHRVKSGHARRTEREIGIDRDDERGDQQRGQKRECGQRERKAAEVEGMLANRDVRIRRSAKCNGLTVKISWLRTPDGKNIERPTRSTRPEAARSCRHSVSDRDACADSYQQVASA